MTERETTSWWLRPARGFGLALSLTVSAAIIFGFVGALGWMVGVPLRWTAAFVGAVCALEVGGVAIAALLRRYVGVSGDVPAILTGAWRRQAERYGGPPAEVVPFLDGLSVSRRPKVPHRLMAVLLLAGAALVLVGAAAPRLFAGALALLAIGYFASVRRGAHALTRLAGHEVEVRSGRLVQLSPDGWPLGEIDLTRPFTYEYLAKGDCVAAYRLRQGAHRVELSSEARAAPWLARDVLRVEWPPVDRAIRDFTRDLAGTHEPGASTRGPPTPPLPPPGVR